MNSIVMKFLVAARLGSGPGTALEFLVMHANRHQSCRAYQNMIKYQCTCHSEIYLFAVASTRAFVLQYAVLSRDENPSDLCTPGFLSSRSSTVHHRCHEETSKTPWMPHKIHNLLLALPPCLAFVSDCDSDRHSALGTASAC